jgi:hypothetical protein
VGAVVDGEVGAVGESLGEALGELGGSLGDGGGSLGDVLGDGLGDPLVEPVGESVGDSVGEGDVEGPVVGGGDPVVGCPVGDGESVDPGVGDDDPVAVGDGPPVPVAEVVGWGPTGGAAPRIATISLWKVSSCSMISVIEYDVIEAANARSWFQTAPRATSCSSPGSWTDSTSWLAIAAVMQL